MDILIVLPQLGPNPKETEMRKILTALLLLLTTAVASAQQDLFSTDSYTVQPERIGFVNGVCKINITLHVAPKSFDRDFVAELTPLFGWGGRSVIAEPLVLQGERGTSFGRIVSFKNGADLTMSMTLNYAEGMENGKLYVAVTPIYDGERVNYTMVEMPVSVDRTPLLVYETAKDAHFYYFHGVKTGDKRADKALETAAASPSADERIEALKAAIEFVPENFMLHNNLALNLLDKGDIEGVREELRKAFELGESPEVATNLCLLEFSQRRVDEARAYLTKAEGGTYYKEARGNLLVADGKYGYATSVMSGLTTNTSILAHILNQEFLVATRLLDKKEPKNAIIKQYEKMLSMDGVQLRFTDEALHAIAKKAMKRDTGARALRSVIEDFMLDIMFQVPKDENIGRVTITEEYVEGTGGPIIDLKGVMELEEASRPRIATSAC